MSSQRFASLFNRLFFVGAFLLFALAVAEKVANWSGYTLIGLRYAPGRLFEFSAIMLLFVITLLLRDIRGERKGGT
jgi:hypothetical protein